MATMVGEDGTLRASDRTPRRMRDPEERLKQSLERIWDLGDQRDVVVHPDGSEPQPPSRIHRAADVTRPDTGREPVIDAVRVLDRLLVAREPLDRHDRAEDLALDHLVALLETRDHGRLEE